MRGPSRYALLANAATYDIQGAAHELDRGTWVLPRGAVAAGDGLLFWRTLGRDRRRGVAALGTVTHPPAMLPGGTAADRFWLAAPPVGPQRRIRFSFTRAPRLPLWLDEDRSGVLAGLSVSRAQGNKLYRVPPASWHWIVTAAGASRPLRDHPPSWTEGAPRKPCDGQTEVDATYHADRAPDGSQSVVLESRGGGPSPRNTEYNRGLHLLLERLAAAGALLEDAYVDSQRVERLAVAERRLVLPEAYPVALERLPDIDAFRKAVGAAGAAVGRAADARGGGNRTKRVRIVVSFPTGGPADLAAMLAGERPSRQASGLRGLAADAPRSASPTAA